MIRSIYRAAIGPIPIIMLALAGCQANISISVQPISPLPAPGVAIVENAMIPAQEAPPPPPEIVVVTATQETLALPPEIVVVTATQETLALPPEIVVVTATQETLALPPEIVVVTATQETLALPPEIAVMTATQETPAEVVASDALLTFTDQTAQAGLAFTHATPITEGDGAQMISGGAAGDFNNDGWVDLYVIGGGLRPDALFVNQGDGTFRDQALAAGLAEPHLGSGAAVGDYDGDGWVDIYVTSFGTPDDMAAGRHRLYRNQGDLTFVDVAAAAGVNQASPALPDGLGAAFGDYDLDGDLDLFVAGWRKPDGAPALGNRLFRNRGDGGFDDVTAAAGIIDDGIRGFGPCFADMDGDRYPELLLAADFGTSRYFHNGGDGSFTDITGAAGTHLTWSAMGSAVGDVNNDGRLDWFLTAIFDDDGVGRGLGNSLYLNQGENRFVDAAASLGVADNGWGWGTAITDFNHDTLPDIAAVNGWNLDSYVNERGRLWLQQPDGTFQDIAAAAGFSEPVNQLGLLTLDYDNDGDQDVVVTAFNGELRLYRNDLAGAGTHWLRVLLDTQGAPGLAPNGSGALVQARVGERTYTRYAGNCAHYLTQSEAALHFGLGDAGRIDELTVTWPNGTMTTLRDLPADQTITVKP